MNALPDRLLWVKEDFDRIAVHGFLGEPDGKVSTAYLRVSSSGQAEEGRSGFPRQILHIHEKAQELHLYIPWELVFFDDHTGFEFRDRPALTKLRELVRHNPRPVDDLVIENLDRLSREATWHQGYLLDEFENECKVKIHFWKELPSKLERVVYGTVAQDRMLTDLERMAAGNIHKAKDKRVTARTPAYGYRFVNAIGGEENYRKDTHYTFNEAEADVMRRVYLWLVKEHATLVEISRRLTQMGITPPKTSRAWEPTLLHKLVANTVYKGEFYAHRFVHVKTVSRITGREVTHKIERPKNEWILVPVPPLVSPEVWEKAQQVMRENRTLSLRNSKREYLLVGLLYCADCKTTKMSTGGRYHYLTTKQGQKRYDSTYYRCINKTMPKHIREVIGCTCTMPQLSSKRLDELVWNTVADILLDRGRLEEGLERFFSRERIETTKEEIAYIQAQLTELELEDERLYQAYVAGAFDADEFALKRHMLKGRKQSLIAEKEKLQQRFSQQASREERKQQILTSVEELKKEANEQTPFELKRRILLKVVEKITVHTREEWFEIEGAISGTFDFTPADMGSSPQLE